MELYGVVGFHVHRCEDMEAFGDENTETNILYTPDARIQQTMLYMERTKDDEVLISIAMDGDKGRTIMMPGRIAGIMFKALMVGIPGGVHIVEDIVATDQNSN